MTEEPSNEVHSIHLIICTYVILSYNFLYIREEEKKVKKKLQKRLQFIFKM